MFKGTHIVTVAWIAPRATAVRHPPRFPHILVIPRGAHRRRFLRGSSVIRCILLRRLRLLLRNRFSVSQVIDHERELLRVAAQPYPYRPAALDEGLHQIQERRLQMRRISADFKRVRCVLLFPPLNRRHKDLHERHDTH